VSSRRRMVARKTGCRFGPDAEGPTRTQESRLGCNCRHLADMLFRSIPAAVLHRGGRGSPSVCRSPTAWDADADDARADILAPAKASITSTVSGSEPRSPIFAGAYASRHRQLLTTRRSSTGAGKTLYRT
jgi:hypothetical protein